MRLRRGGRAGWPAGGEPGHVQLGVGPVRGGQGMKPFRDRNPVAVGAVGLAVLAGVVFAAFHLDDLAAFNAAGSYRAAFRDPTGLVPATEARDAGARAAKATAGNL